MWLKEHETCFLTDAERGAAGGDVHAASVKIFATVIAAGCRNRSQTTPLNRKSDLVLQKKKKKKSQTCA